MRNSSHDTPSMNPPQVPHQYTPQRESSVAAPQGSGTPARKPRQNLDERDHQMMLKHCLEQRHSFKEGNKAQFWTGVNSSFQQDTGKVLAQMSATVGRLVEARRRQIADWESGVLQQKPGGGLNEMLDQWIEFLRVEEPEGEAERMRQVEIKRKNEEARKEARRQALAAESAVVQANHQTSLIPQNGLTLTGQPQQGVLVPGVGAMPHNNGARDQANGDPDANRPNKRKRQDERAMARELATRNGAHSQVQAEAEAEWHARRQPDQPTQATQPSQLPPPPPSVLQAQIQASPSQQALVSNQPSGPPQYYNSYPSTAPPGAQAVRKVVVEGALTKEDWREIMGNDARLRALESKVDRIELLLSQNNKLLLQLVQNQSHSSHKDSGHREGQTHRPERLESPEDDRVPVHLDAEFERDYL